VPPRDPVDVCREAATIAGFDVAPFERVLGHVRRDVTLKPADARSVLDEYVRGVERLVAHLDQHDGGTTP